MIPQYSNLADQVAQLQNQLTQFGQIQPQQFVSQAPVAPVLPMREEIKKVNGIEGAKEYQKNLAPNSNAVVFDNEKDVCYLVMKDANGISPELMNYGEFVMHQEETPESIYATKEDLNKLMSEIKKLVEVSK